MVGRGQGKGDRSSDDRRGSVGGTGGGWGRLTAVSMQGKDEFSRCARVVLRGRLKKSRSCRACVAGRLFFIAYRNFRKATRSEHAIKAAIEDTTSSIVFLTDSGLFTG